LEADVLVAIGFAFRIPALDVEDHRVAVLDAAVLDRLELRAALAELLQRLVDGLVINVGGVSRGRDGRKVADVERRHGLDSGRERERLSLFERDVLDVRRVHRLDTALLQRFIDGARNQAVRDVVEDLLLEPLLDQRGRHLAGPEAGDARLLGVALGNAIDLGSHDIDRDLDREGLLRGADVSELGLHRGLWALGLGLWAFGSSRARGNPEPKAQSREPDCERRDSNPHTLSGTRS